MLLEMSSILCTVLRLFWGPTWKATLNSAEMVNICIPPSVVTPEGFLKLGIPFWGFILGFPHFGKVPCLHSKAQICIHSEARC